MKCFRVLYAVMAMGMVLPIAAVGYGKAGSMPAAQGRPAAVPDDDANAPYKTFDATPAITMGPLLLDMSDTSVVVEWMTDAASDGKVSYGEGKIEHEVIPQVDGLVPVGTVHRVVLRGLLPGRTYQYKVSSRRVVALKPYWPDRGQTVESPAYSFTTFDAAKKTTDFAVVTDTHEDVGRIRALMDLIHQAPVDFVVHTGDSLNYGVSENQLKDKFLEPVATGLQGRTPLQYVRGNHEYRGEFARSLGEYLHAQSGKYFYTRDQGPLHMVMVDTGEDKADATNVYAGLNNLRDYKQEEFAWLKQVLVDETRVRTAPFTVVFGHDSRWGWVDGGPDPWTQLANQAQVDLFIAGHEHRYEHITPGKRGNDFSILVLGQDQVARVEASDQALKVTVVDRTGKTIDAFSIQRKNK
ncbi:FN3 domain-containing metallophosphoesterase family protein [Dyella subtropica]|uniref:FN3 domain-containing metallophosphoesterase family protein n=1 Tax=Dyella subtropica TaxID=2992127 RepID=UPI00224F6066|nr:FN3 domain-containing metallophosphoesterase family protein [Dyella subtropica]